MVDLGRHYVQTNPEVKASAAESYPPAGLNEKHSDREWHSIIMYYIIGLKSSIRYMMIYWWFILRTVYADDTCGFIQQKNDLVTPAWWSCFHWLLGSFIPSFGCIFLSDDFGLATVSHTVGDSLWEFLRCSKQFGRSNAQNLSCLN